MAAYKRIKSPRNPSKGVYTVPYRGGLRPPHPPNTGARPDGPASDSATLRPKPPATGLRFAPSEAWPISWSEFGTTPTYCTCDIFLLKRGGSRLWPRSLVLQSDLFSFFFQPEQYFFLTAIQSEQCFGFFFSQIQRSERGHWEK